MIIVWKKKVSAIFEKNQFIFILKVFECKISNGDQATIHYVVEYKFKFHNCLSLTYVSISLTITDIRINKSYMYLIVYFQSFNDGPPKARNTWSEDNAPQDISFNNGKRVPKRRITVVGINAVEEAQQEPGTHYGQTTLFRCDFVLFAQKFLFEILYYLIKTIKNI